jgi:hypothetical protein
VLVNYISRAKGGRLRTSKASAVSHEQRLEMLTSEARSATKRLAEKGSRALAGLAIDAREQDVKKVRDPQWLKVLGVSQLGLVNCGGSGSKEKGLGRSYGWRLMHGFDIE